ncbi:unnamed protein product [Amoebophrya sp. A120]|nr:unnamed protein product [Amoebophrya sp. A120]|eukprot:GSA120T00008797001.1
MMPLPTGSPSPSGRPLDHAATSNVEDHGPPASAAVPQQPLVPIDGVFKGPETLPPPAIPIQGATTTSESNSGGAASHAGAAAPAAAGALTAPGISSTSAIVPAPLPYQHTDAEEQLRARFEAMVGPLVVTNNSTNPNASNSSTSNQPSNHPQTSSLSLPFSTLTSGRKKVFQKTILQAHVCCVINEEQIAPVMAILRQDNKFRNVRNWIYAYRIREVLPHQEEILMMQQKMRTNGVQGKEQDEDFYNTTRTGYEDGGEQGAGGKLLSLLSDSLQLENLLVVITRWDTGTPGRLGGRLYSYINALCKELLSDVKKAIQEALPGTAEQVEREKLQQDQHHYKAYDRNNSSSSSRSLVPLQENGVMYHDDISTAGGTRRLGAAGAGASHSNNKTTTLMDHQYHTVVDPTGYNTDDTEDNFDVNQSVIPPFAPQRPHKFAAYVSIRAQQEKYGNLNAFAAGVVGGAVGGGGGGASTSSSGNYAGASANTRRVGGAAGSAASATGGGAPGTATVQGAGTLAGGTGGANFVGTSHNTAVSQQRQRYEHRVRKGQAKNAEDANAFFEQCGAMKLINPLECDPFVFQVQNQPVLDPHGASMGRFPPTDLIVDTLQDPDIIDDDDCLDDNGDFFITQNAATVAPTVSRINVTNRQGGAGMQHHVHTTTPTSKLSTSQQQGHFGGGSSSSNMMHMSSAGGVQIQPGTQLGGTGGSELEPVVQRRGGQEQARGGGAAASTGAAATQSGTSTRGPANQIQPAFGAGAPRRPPADKNLHAASSNITAQRRNGSRTPRGSSLNAPTTRGGSGAHPAGSRTNENLVQQNLITEFRFPSTLELSPQGDKNSDKEWRNLLIKKRAADFMIHRAEQERQMREKENHHNHNHLGGDAVLRDHDLNTTKTNPAASALQQQTRKRPVSCAYRRDAVPQHITNTIQELTVRPATTASAGVGGGPLAGLDVGTSGGGRSTGAGGAR